jgi:hypothetical protein
MMRHMDWIIRQLDLQPHQHLLEVGCGSGRLLLFSQPGHYRQEDDLRTEAARLQAAFLKAGLTDIHTEYQFHKGACIAVTGLKPPQYIDRQSVKSINNRLLNSEASFISKVVET